MTVFGADFIEIFIFRVKVLKKEIDDVMCTSGSNGGYPKLEIVPIGLAILGNICSLLMEEKAISPLILNILVALLFWNIFLICMCTYPLC